MGSAVARVLGLSVRTTVDLEAFLRRALVRTYGEGLDANPEASFDPGVGEAFEFHVGLRDAADASRVGEVEAAARQAVALSRNFSLA